MRSAWSTDTVSGQSALDSNKQKAGEDISEQWVMFQCLQAPELGSLTHVVLALKLSREETVYEICLKKVIDAMHVSEVVLKGQLIENVLFQVVK